MTPHTFHTFYPKTWEGNYYLDYEGEVTMAEIVDAILHDPLTEKTNCPAIVMNRFKEVERRRDFTIKNQYALLDHTTGYFALDVDNTNTLTPLVKRTLFDSLPELFVVWTSSSGKGIKAIGFSPKLANLTAGKFKMAYRVLSVELRVKCGMRINFDQAMARCHQPVFINSDPNALYRI